MHHGVKFVDGVVRMLTLWKLHGPPETPQNWKYNYIHSLSKYIFSRKCKAANVEKFAMLLHIIQQTYWSHVIEVNAQERCGKVNTNTTSNQRLARHERRLFATRNHGLHVRREELSRLYMICVE